METLQNVRPDRSEDESDVLDALMAAAGSSINDITRRYGGSTARTGQALATLEAQGLVRFRCGRWTVGPSREPPSGSKPRPA